MGYMDNMKNHVELGVVKTMLNSTEARELARIKSSGTSSSVHPKNHKKNLDGFRTLKNVVCSA